jgi:hypothetical protein
MFPGQFGNANKCLRASSVSNGYTGTFNVTSGSNPCKYFVFYSNSTSGSITWDKGLGNVQYALVGGGGAGYGYTDVINSAGNGGDGGSVVVGQSQNPNLNGDTISVTTNSLTQSFTTGIAGSNATAQLPQPGGSTTWNGRTAAGGNAGTDPGAATGNGGAGSGGARSGAAGGIGTLVYLLLEDPTTSTFPANSYSPVNNTIGFNVSFSYPKYGAGGGGGDSVRRVNAAAYSNLGGTYLGGFGMYWPTGDSLWSASTGGTGGGGGGGGNISSGGTTYYRLGASGGAGLIILRTQY